VKENAMSVYYIDAEDIVDPVDDSDVETASTESLKGEQSDLETDIRDLEWLIRQLNEHIGDAQMRLSQIEDEICAREFEAYVDEAEAEAKADEPA
jgi:hypothetical protein